MLSIYLTISIAKIKSDYFVSFYPLKQLKNFIMLIHLKLINKTYEVLFHLYF